MRILLVSHNVPPHGTGGTETYVHELAHALAGRGHATSLFAAKKDVALRDGLLLARDDGPVRVRELVNNLYHAEFSGTWRNDAAERAFAGLLDEARPDVVHVNHLMHLSAALPQLAKERGARVVYTLHDFWLSCPRLGQRVHADGTICHDVVFERCGTCLARFAWRQPKLARTVGPLLAKISARTGLDLSGLARGVRGRLAAPQAPAPEAERALARAASERWTALAAEVLPATDLFLSPSRFLRERFLAEWPLEPKKIEHLPFGIDRARFGGARVPASDGRLRIAFLGQLVPLKGAHLLLSAWARVDPALRARARLVLRGPARGGASYQRELERAARASGAQLLGPLARADVGAFLRATDLLVVPSLWYENSPLAIQEALACRTPLAVSDLGGMAELVEPGVSGVRFKVGDVQDLERVLTRAIEAPAELARLYQPGPTLPSFDEHVDALLARYAK